MAETIESYTKGGYPFMGRWKAFRMNVQFLKIRGDNPNAGTPMESVIPTASFILYARRSFQNCWVEYR